MRRWATWKRREPTPDSVPEGGPVPELEIRPASARDLTAVAEIEARAFTNPWSRKTFVGLIDRPGASIWVAVLPGGGVVGYAVLWCILDEGELANIAVREAWQGRGVGSRLLERVFAGARERDVRRLHLEVRASNQRALEFYLRRGFAQVGRRRDYYDCPREDALLLTKRLDD